jgi:hypothetical protein
MREGEASDRSPEESEEEISDGDHMVKKYTMDELKNTPRVCGCKFCH